MHLTPAITSPTTFKKMQLKLIVEVKIRIRRKIIVEQWGYTGIIIEKKSF